MPNILKHLFDGLVLLDYVNHGPAETVVTTAGLDAREI